MNSLRWRFVLVGLLASGLVLSCASAQSFTGPVYVITHVDVGPANGGVEKTNKLLLEFAAASRKDSGCVRFEVLVQDGRPNHTAIVEVWQSRAAFQAHLEAPYAKKFREGLQPMLGSPFDERLHALLQ